MDRNVTQSDLSAAVQQRPELRDTGFARRSDRVQKKKAWKEVYKTLPHWDLLSAKEKEGRDAYFCMPLLKRSIFISNVLYTKNYKGICKSISQENINFNSSYKYLNS